jgi:hypothetical protein
VICDMCCVLCDMCCVMCDVGCLLRTVDPHSLLFCSSKLKIIQKIILENMFRASSWPIKQIIFYFKFIFFKCFLSKNILKFKVGEIGHNKAVKNRNPASQTIRKKPMQNQGAHQEL